MMIRAYDAHSWTLMSYRLQPLIPPTLTLACLVSTQLHKLIWQER